jgi:putative endonuclease
MDIIARDEETLVFCQVATRRASSKGFPEEVLSTPAARAKLEAVAITYLAEHPDSAEYRFRFDSIALIVLSESRAAVRHHINVFGATGEID